MLAGVPVHSGSSESGMMDCCKKALEQDASPHVAAARLCCAMNCNEPGSTSSNTSQSWTTVYVDADGYRPTNVVLRRGIPTRLTFIRTLAEGCGTEIVIPALGINRPLPLNVPVVVSFTPNKSGRFKLTCGMDMFRGSLIVR